MRYNLKIRYTNSPINLQEFPDFCKQKHYNSVVQCLQQDK